MKPTPTPFPNRRDLQNLTGRVFGVLTVIDYGGKQGRHSAWVCRCECGSVVQHTATNLKRGRVYSCGCRRAERIALNRTEHGHTKGYNASPEYRAWSGMKRRCLHPNSSDYPDYGGRGITIHPPWVESFEAFLRDVGPKPKGRYSLGRKDNDGHYVPGNVIWETSEQQARNRRNVIMYQFNGASRCLTDWGRELGIPGGVLRRRLKRGWTLEKTLTTPAREQNYY